MKHQYRFIVIIIFVTIVNSGYLKAQDKTYWSTGFEMIFSFADIQQDGISKSSIFRWAPVFNLQTFFNYDATKRFGLFSGIGVRNVGFIYDESDGIRKKYRTYNVGVPVGLKVGNFDKTFVYAGYEIELPFNYKEKTFENDVKSKYTEWFTDRIPTVYHTVLIGIQLPRGVNIKFKYYLTGFFNQDFVEVDGTTGDPYQPYENLDVNVFFFSIGFNLFRDKELYFTD
ncbi:MAG: hypothetical protein PVH48_09010 [Cyclobacteriaceae bacterium]|jgi:hypothetical protein